MIFEDEVRRLANGKIWLKAHATEKERKTGDRKIGKSRTMVSEHTHPTFIYFDNLKTVMIDISPLEKVETGLQKQGASPNQLMGFLSTYSADFFDAEATNRYLADIGNACVTVAETPI